MAFSLRLQKRNVSSIPFVTHLTLAISEVTGIE